MGWPQTEGEQMKSKLSNFEELLRFYFVEVDRAIYLFVNWLINQEKIGLDIDFGI